jgi:hypothetical protein
VKSNIFWRCQQCGTRVPVEKMECPECERAALLAERRLSEPAERSCPACGVSVADGAGRFCSRCGAALPAGETIDAVANRTPFVEDFSAHPEHAHVTRWVADGWKARSSAASLIGIGALAGFLTWVVPVILMGSLAAGFHLMYLRRMKGLKAGLTDLFQGFNYFTDTLVLTIFLMLLTVPSAILGVAGGVIGLAGLTKVSWWALLGFGLIALSFAAAVGAVVVYGFGCLMIVDRRMKCVQALGAAQRVIRRDWSAFVRFVLLLCVCYAGAALVIVGFGIVLAVSFTRVLNITNVGVELVSLAAAVLAMTAFAALIPFTHAAVTAAYRELVGFASDQRAAAAAA